MERITEKQLVLPALYLMARNNDDGFITTSELISKLTDAMRPTKGKQFVCYLRTADKRKSSDYIAMTYYEW